DAGPLGRDVDDVGGEPLAGDLERRPRASGVLEEEVHDGAAAQRRELLDRAVLHVVHLGGRVEQRHDVDDLEIVDGEQVLLHAGTPSLETLPIREIRTSSSPSASSSRTITRSLWALGRFLPTWS